MLKEKILIVDDEEHILELLKFNIKNAGYEVITANNGIDGLNLAKEEKPSLVLLDLMIPGMDGYDVCKEIKKNNETSNIAIIMLTAKGEELDKILGLELGADDYITKPFSLIVLISKVNAFMRRIGNTIIENIIFCDKLKFDYVENKLTKDKEEILLSKNEGKLLKYLMENSSQTVTKEKLMEALWDIDGNFVDENTVAVNIRRLRQKVEDNPSEPEYIKNIRGVGYTFAKRCIKK